MDASLHVVFGAGQVGAPLARRLAAAGHRVRVVRRGTAAVGPGIEVVSGSADDAGFVAAQLAGATTAYHCINPPYSVKDWARDLPRWAEHFIAGTGRAGARLVVLDNLYALGRTGGRPMNEDSPLAPSSRKGEVRALVTRRLLEAHARGEAAVTIARASDYWGPGGTLTYFGDQTWPAIFAGKPVRWPGPAATLETPHTYHFIDDVAAGLAALGECGDDVCGRSWMLPCHPAVSTSAMLLRLADALGRPIPVASSPVVVLTVLGWFIPILRELGEMRYQWEEPFLVDDRRFRARFPEVRPVPTREAAEATVAWAKAHYR